MEKLLTTWKTKTLEIFFLLKKHTTEAKKTIFKLGKGETESKQLQPKTKIKGWI